MAEYKPLTKEERETHAAFCERQLRVRIGNSEEAILHDMAHLSLRYEATVQDRDDRIVALEAENAHLRPLAATGEAVEGMPAGYALHHYDDASWLVRESNLSGWEKLPFPPTVTGAMKKAAEEYSYDPTWDAALRAAKGEDDE